MPTASGRKATTKSIASGKEKPVRKAQSYNAGVAEIIERGRGRWCAFSFLALLPMQERKRSGHWVVSSVVWCICMGQSGCLFS